MDECVICRGNTPSDDSKDGVPIHKECWYRLRDEVGYDKAIDRINGADLK